MNIENSMNIEKLRKEFADAKSGEARSHSDVLRIKAVAKALREISGRLSEYCMRLLLEEKDAALAVAAHAHGAALDLRKEVMSWLVEYQNLDIISTHHDLGYTPEDMLEEEEVLKEELKLLQ